MSKKIFEISRQEIFTKSNISKIQTLGDLNKVVLQMLGYFCWTISVIFQGSHPMIRTAGSLKSGPKRTPDEGGRTPSYEPDEFESDFELDIELIEDFRLCRRRESYPYPGWLFIPFI